MTDPAKRGIEQQIYSFDSSTIVWINTISGELAQEYVPEIHVFERSFGPIIYNYMYTQYSFDETERFTPSAKRPFDLRSAMTGDLSRFPIRTDFDGQSSTNELLIGNRIYDTNLQNIPAGPRSNLIRTLRDVDSDGIVDFIDFFGTANSQVSFTQFWEYNPTTKIFETRSTLGQGSAFPRPGNQNGVVDIAVKGSEITYLSDKRDKPGAILYSNGFETSSVKITQNNTIIPTNRFKVQEVYPGGTIYNSQPVIYPFRLAIDDINGDGLDDLIIATAGIANPANSTGRSAPQVIQIYLSPEPGPVEGSTLAFY